MALLIFYMELVSDFAYCLLQEKRKLLFLLNPLSKNSVLCVAEAFLSLGLFWRAMHGSCVVVSVTFQEQHPNSREIPPQTCISTSGVAQGEKMTQSCSSVYG